MEKFRSLVIAFVAMLVLGGSAFAVNVTTNTFSGLADFSGSGAAQFSFTLKNVTGNATATTINWSTTTAFNTTSNDRWIRAEQYAVVAATVTKAGFNVYMYQTNGNSTVYRSTIPRTNKDGSKAYSGLVRSGSYGGEHRGYIPIAYSLVAQSSPTITFDGTDRIWTRTEGTGFNISTIAVRTDRFLCDVADSSAANTDGTGYPDGKGHYTKIASFGGPVFGSDYEDKDHKKYEEPIDWGSADVKDNTAYMYFFGNFKNIVGGDVYGTDQLHIVQVTE